MACHSTQFSIYLWEVGIKPIYKAFIKGDKSIDA